MNYRLTDFLLFSPEVYWQLLSEFALQFSWQAFLWWAFLLTATYLAWRTKTVLFTNLTLVAGWLFLSFGFYLQLYVQLNPYATILGYLGLVQVLLFCYLTWVGKDKPQRPSLWSCGISVLIPAFATMLPITWQLLLLGVAPQFTIVWTLLYCWEQKIRIWTVLPAIFLFIIESLTLVACYSK